MFSFSISTWIIIIVIVAVVLSAFASSQSKQDSGHSRRRTRPNQASQGQVRYARILAKENQTYIPPSNFGSAAKMNKYIRSLKGSNRRR